MLDIDDTISDFVTSRLSNLVWGRDYPIHPNVALDCVTKAFTDCGFDVKPDRDLFTLEFYNKDASHTRSYEDVLGGHWYFPKGSPQSIVLNIEEICAETVQIVSGLRYQPIVTEVTASFHKRLYKELGRFQENALLPTTNVAPELKSPDILRNVRSFYTGSDLAEIFFKGDLTESLTDRDLKCEQNKLWAGYLQRLSEVKGYKIKYTMTKANE